MEGTTKRANRGKDFLLRMLSAERMTPQSMLSSLAFAPVKRPFRDLRSGASHDQVAFPWLELCSRGWEQLRKGGVIQSFGQERGQPCPREPDSATERADMGCPRPILA